MTLNENLLGVCSLVKEPQALGWSMYIVRRAYTLIVETMLHEPLQKLCYFLNESTIG